MEIAVGAPLPFEQQPELVVQLLGPAEHRRHFGGDRPAPAVRGRIGRASWRVPALAEGRLGIAHTPDLPFEEVADERHLIRVLAYVAFKRCRQRLAQFPARRRTQRGGIKMLALQHPREPGQHLVERGLVRLTGERVELLLEGRAHAIQRQLKLDAQRPNPGRRRTGRLGRLDADSVEPVIGESRRSPGASAIEEIVPQRVPALSKVVEEARDARIGYFAALNDAAENSQEVRRIAHRGQVQRTGRDRIAQIPGERSVLKVAVGVQPQRVVERCDSACDVGESDLLCGVVGPQRVNEGGRQRTVDPDLIVRIANCPVEERLCPRLLPRLSEPPGLGQYHLLGRARRNHFA